MIYGKPYQYPPEVFKPGDRVRFWSSEDRDMGTHAYIVGKSDHCWCWLEELDHQVANWRLKRVRQRAKKPVDK